MQTATATVEVVQDDWVNLQNWTNNATWQVARRLFSSDRGARFKAHREEMVHSSCSEDYIFYILTGMMKHSYCINSNQLMLTSIEDKELFTVLLAYILEQVDWRQIINRLPEWE